MPPILQLAADGSWEDALSAPLPAAPAAVDRLLERVLADAGADVAAELLWEGPPIVFVGARFGLDEARELRDRLRALAPRAEVTPPVAVELLAGGPLGPPVRAELGAVNAWKTIQPLRLPLECSEQEIEARLAERPDLAGSGLPLALEVVHDRPREAWTATELAQPSARP